MNILDRMLNDQICVNWSTILIGWNGPANYVRQLSIADIASYAQELIAASPECPKDVLKLAGAQDDETEMVEASLKKLAAQENADQENELRKWRLYLLKELEPILPDDPLYGLIALTEFWDKFDYTEDNPHVVQGRGNHQKPEEYYTQENFFRLRRQHREWMKKERSVYNEKSEDHNASIVAFSDFVQWSDSGITEPFPPLMSPLQQLIGSRIIKAEVGAGELQLWFDNCACLSVYNEYQVTGPDGQAHDLDGLVGASLTQTREEEARICLPLSNGLQLSIDMSEEGYTGPEAMQLTRAGAPTVVWRLDD